MEFQAGGKVFDVRPLRRGEIRRLKAAGFVLHDLSMDDVDTAMDAVFEMLFPGRSEEIDELEYPDVLRLWREVMAETYGDRDEEKNSSAGGGGS